jgi:hypothetical protein
MMNPLLLDWHHDVDSLLSASKDGFIWLINLGVNCQQFSRRRTLLLTFAILLSQLLLLTIKMKLAALLSSLAFLATTRLGLAADHGDEGKYRNERG